MRIEDFADEAGLEAVEEFREYLAEFQVALLRVEAKDVTVIMIDRLHAKLVRSFSNVIETLCSMNR